MPNRDRCDCAPPATRCWRGIEFTRTVSHLVGAAISLLSVAGFFFKYF